jgi:hypothetical protein
MEVVEELLSVAAEVVVEEDLPSVVVVAVEESHCHSSLEVVEAVLLDQH